MPGRASLGRLKAATKHDLLRFIAWLTLPHPQATGDFSHVHRILIYGAMGIGNMIMFTPTLKAIRQRFPGAHITLLVAQSGCEEVVRGSSLVDEITKAMSTNRWQTLRLARYVRRGQFDLVISDFHGSTYRMITALSGIPYRVGHCTSPGWESQYDFLYNIQVRMGEDEHEIDRGLRLIEALGIQERDDTPVFHVSDDDRAFADDFLRENSIQDGDLSVGVQIGSWRVQGWKQWDIARLARVCDRLIEEYEAKVIALGSPEHRTELDAFLYSMKHQPKIALGKATLKQAAAIVERCNFTICNDSGLMHVSAAMGTPVIAVYGPTDFHRTSPRRYGEQHVVVRKTLGCSPCFRMAGGEQAIACTHRSCLELITVEDVVQASAKVIAALSMEDAGSGDRAACEADAGSPRP